MRRAPGWIALCTAALLPGGSAVLPAAVPGAPAAPYPAAGAPFARGAGDTGVTTYAYGRHQDQRVTVYAPPAKARGDARPAVLLLHGGYWAYRATWRDLPYLLADQGFVVLDAGYTLSPNGRWPAQFEDARRALAWTRKHAKRLALDPDRVLVMGSSAGGQLAALLGTHRTSRDRVRGVIALSPVVSPFDAWREGARPAAGERQRRLRIAAEELVGCRPLRTERACRARWRGTGVARYASDRAAPMLLVHSAGDYVPAAHSRALAEVLPDASVRVVPGPGHGRGLLAAPGVTAEVVRWAKDRTR